MINTTHSSSGKKSKGSKNAIQERNVKEGVISSGLVTYMVKLVST